MLKIRDKNGGIKFIPSAEDLEKKKLLEQISTLDKKVKSLETKLESLETALDSLEV